jgi:hypothetical protein
MKSTIFCDLTPCSPVKVHRRFGGTYCLHLHSRRVSTALHAACFLLCLLFGPEDGGICSSEMSERGYIPEGSTHHTCRCKNLKCNIISSEAIVLRIFKSRPNATCIYKHYKSGQIFRTPDVIINENLCNERTMTYK